MENQFDLKEEEIQVIENDLNAKLKSADPITWTYVLKKVGEGFLKAIGSEIFKQLFGKGVDLKKLMENLLNQIDRVIVHRLEQAFINQALIRADVIKSALLDYTNSPSQDRLLQIEENARWLVSEFENYKFKTYKEFFLAITYRLFVYEENLKNGNLGEKDNIIRQINEATSHIQSLNSQLRSISDKWFRIGSESFLDYDFDGRLIGLYGSYWIQQNGKRISKKFNYLSSSSSRRSAESDAKKRIE